MEAPWLLFESGALSKSVAEASVYTLLTGGLRIGDIEGPLSHFQHTVFEKEDFFKLVKSINEGHGHRLHRERAATVLPAGAPALSLASAYAVTIHKSQGSEFPGVVIPVPTATETSHPSRFGQGLIKTGSPGERVGINKIEQIIGGYNVGSDCHPIQQIGRGEHVIMPIHRALNS